MKNKIQLLVIASAILLFTLKNVLGYSPLLINVLNDILALPFILICMNFIMKRIYGTKFSMTINFAMITFLTVSVLFEIIFPMFSSKLTSDGIDIILYLIGTALFLTIRQYISKSEEELNSFV